MQKAYKIIQQPMSKKFEKEWFSRKCTQIEEKLSSFDLIKVAEALRDIKGAYLKERNSAFWEEQCGSALNVMRTLVINIENIDYDEGWAIVLAKTFKTKTVKENLNLMKILKKKKLN